MRREVDRLKGFKMIGMCDGDVDMWWSWKNGYQHGYVHEDNGMRLKVMDMVDGDIRDGRAW